MRWRLNSLFLATATIAAALAVFSTGNKVGHPNHPLYLGIYLVVLSAIAAIAVYGRRFRGAAFAATLFGSVYLLCVLHGGFGLKTINDAEWLAGNAKLGLGLVGLSFLVGLLILRLIGSNEQEHQQHGTLSGN